MSNIKCIAGVIFIALRYWSSLKMTKPPYGGLVALELNTNLMVSPKSK